tara:strand:+ start:959 stop:1633 length:675 start_codon:yes stop_codon:yes gene_type:complete
MSVIRVNELKSEDGAGAPTAPNGLNVVGVCTATSFVGSGANLTGISAGMTLVGVTTVGATGGSPTSFEFTNLDPDSIYNMTGWLRLASTGTQFLAQAKVRETNGTQYDFGAISAYESHTNTMNSDYGNQSSSSWYFYNNYTLSNELWFDMTFSTYTFPWVRMNYGGVRSGYVGVLGQGNGTWTNNPQTTQIEGIKIYNNSGSGYNQPTRVHLYKLQTTGIGTHY